MLRRALLRQSRLLSQRPSSASPVSFSRSYISPSPRISAGFTQSPSVFSSRSRTFATKSEEERGRDSEPITEAQSSIQNEGKTGGAGIQDGTEQPGKSNQAAESEDPIAKDLATKDKEILELKDKYLRSVAEFRNLQERTKRETQAARDFAIQRFARDLIDSVDNLDRALSTVQQPGEGSPENKDLQNLLDGLKMTERILMQTLEKHGLKRFDPAENAEKFDPNLHEATFQAPQQDKEDGTVFFTQQKGFLLNGRVLRAAKVGVVKNS